MSLQNLKEDQLYQLLPSGIIDIDEQNILRALIGGVQDRLEDIRSYARKFEFFFTAQPVNNTCVIVQFDTAYGKTVTRSLDIQDTTPSVEGIDLTAWAVDQLGIDASQVTSVVIGEDLLRFVDTSTLQYLAATIGAILYQTAAQTGSETLNQGKILNSYFPRLKIKGTAQSFDILGKLIGFDDVRMTPLWGRLSPRQPNDTGAAVNDVDFAQTPQYYPQQDIGVAYDPHVFRDGPYYTWTGTVSASELSTYFYTQSVNGFQPWVKVMVSGTVAHPAAGEVLTLAGGSPHTAATATAGDGLTFQALGEGEDFNGLQVRFSTWNDGTDRLISITDRLSAIKYRTSYFDLALTLTDEHAQAQFGTTTSKPNKDLQANPALVDDLTATSPYRPWRAGAGDSGAVLRDYVWVSSGSVAPVSRRSQATTAVTESKISSIESAGQEAVRIFEEVRAATRTVRKSSVGFLNRDNANYAAYHESNVLFTSNGSDFIFAGTATGFPLAPYTLGVTLTDVETSILTWDSTPGYTYEPFVTYGNFQYIPTVVPFGFFANPVASPVFVATSARSRLEIIRGTPVEAYSLLQITPPVMGLGFDLENGYGSEVMQGETDPNDSNRILFKSLIANGTYHLDTNIFSFQFDTISPSTQAVAHWIPLSTEVVRENPELPEAFQVRPEDEMSEEVVYETVDEFPWRRDLVGDGELVELINRFPPLVADATTLSVSSNIAMRDHTGADYSVNGIQSTVTPIRLVAQVNSTTVYVPGQLPIAYSGDFTDLSDVAAQTFTFPQLTSYGTDSFHLYHAGLVQGVFVADPVAFYSPAHRNGLKLWLPFNEHPDEGAVVYDHSTSVSQQTLSGFTLNGSFADRSWNSSVGWHISVGSGASIIGESISQVQPELSLSFWFSGSLTGVGGADCVLYKQGPLSVHVGSGGTNVVIDYAHKDNTVQNVASLAQVSTDFNQVAVVVEDQYVRYGIADRNTSLVLSTGTLSANYQPFNGTHNDFLISCPRNHVQLSDLRVWNRAKTQTELDNIRDYQPTPTVCTYWPTNIEVAGNGDRYGLKVLDNGFLSPDVMPPAIRLNQLMRVIRYTDEGRYEGENRFNEVGLGGGTPLPPTWKLGQQFYEMTAAGTTVFSTSLGGGPYNPLWQLAGTHSYVGLPFNGSTSSGIPGIGTNYPSATWPPPMDFNNPAHEFIWIKGDDGKVHEISLVSKASGVTMVGSLVVRIRSDDELVLNGALHVVTAQPADPHSILWQTTGTAWTTFNNGTFFPNQVVVETDGTAIVSIDQNSHGVSVLTDGTGIVKIYHPQSFVSYEEPTGAISVLVSGGTELTCNYGGYVYQHYTGGTLTTPPLYMYLTALTLEPVSGLPDNAYAAWTDKTDNTLYGNRLPTPLAALDSNGVMEFENTSNLSPGHYRLTIDSGCIGRVDQDFDGFSVAISIDTTTIETRLQAGQSGADFRSKDVIEFDYDTTVVDNWLLSIQYLNTLVDLNRGTARNFVIYGYKLEKIETDLYKVSIGAGPAPTLTQTQTGTYSGTNPGGWLAIINSYGSLSSVVHESQVFPSNDTVVSHVPLSSMLTSDTWMRREDHYTAASSLSVLPDSATVANPSFGGIIVR